MSSKTIKAAITSCIESVNRHPQNAQMIYVAETRLEDGMRVTSKVRDFPALVIDEPAMFGGTDKGMAPGELLLSAMGACQEIMYSTFATMLDVKLDGVEITCHGDLDLHGMLAIDDNICPGFTSISFEVRITSSDSPKKIRNLMALAQTHCPLLDTITRPVPVNSRTYLNGDLVVTLQEVVPI